MKPLILKAVLLASAITTLAASISSVEAGERSKERTTTRNAGSVQRDTTWQNQRGTGSSSYDREADRETKSWTANRSVTGAKGKTSTSVITGQKTENGRTSDTITTFENGKVVNKSVAASHADGTATHSTTLTGPNGQVKTYTRSRTYNP